MLGPLMLDLHGTALDAEEKELLQHPLVGAVILFARNYQDEHQIAELCTAIRRVRPELLIAVDQEGGRVQRLKEPFSSLPPLADIAKKARTPAEAIEHARQWAMLMSLEVQSVGIDFSFAPVLDLGNPISEIIGDRAFAEQPEAIVPLARAYLEGMRQAGMASTGKHFPGHGSVAEDSHVAIPVDPRPRHEIVSSDMKVFAETVDLLSAVMPAHVIYPEVDERPAGFSPIWLQDILRKVMGFDGVIFSDDLSMKGAEQMGNYHARAEAALEAGCDMVLVCNNRAGAIEVLDSLTFSTEARSAQRLEAMRGRHLGSSLASLRQSTEWRQVKQQLA